MQLTARSASRFLAGVSTLTLAGCSSSGGGHPATSSETASTPSSVPVTTRTVTTSVAATPAPSRTSTSAAPKTTSTAARRCSTANSSVTARTLTPAGGSFYVVIALKNTGSRRCVTAGYPGVAITNAAHQQVFQAVRFTQSYSTISLAPGQSASAVLSGSDHREPGGTSCPRFASLLVTPPDTTRSIALHATTYGCESPSIKPLTRGINGDLAG